MYSLTTPFRFNASGGTASTSDMKQILQQQIIDILSTSYGERVMRPEYGANFMRLLFEPMDDLIFSEYSMDAIQTLNENIEFGKVLDVRVSAPSSNVFEDTTSGTIYVSVQYVLPPDTVDVFMFAIGDQDYVSNGGLF